MKKSKLSQFAIITLLIGASTAWAQSFNGQITVQAIAATGYTGPDVNRTNYPVYSPIVFQDGDVTGTSLSTLGLDCVRSGGVCIAGSPVPAAAQFLCMSTWPDGNCKSAIVYTEIANWTAGQSVPLQVTLTGSGSFGGSNLATMDNDCAGSHSGYLCINSTGGAIPCGSVGATCWTLQTGAAGGGVGFDLFHKVTVNTHTIVDAATSPSDGVVIMGPAGVNTANLVPAAPVSAPTFATTVPCTVNCPAAARTYFASISYTSPNGESPDSPVSTSITVPAGSKLSIACPAGTTTATGCNIYACTGSGSGTCALQTPFISQPLNSTWVEPDACRLTGSDGVVIGIAQTNCNRTSTNVGGGVLNYTRSPETYSAGGNSGCEVKDPVSGSTTCNVAYKSVNDTGSSAVIEENGPVETEIKVITSLASASGTACPAAGVLTTGLGTPGCQLHSTIRLQFFKGQNFVRQTSILQNADLAPCSGSGAGITCGTGNVNQGFAASDAKAFQSYSLSVALAGSGIDSGAKTFAIKGDPTVCGGGICTGALDGAHDAFFYQAFSCLFIRSEGEGNIFTTGSDTVYNPVLFPYGPRTTNCQQSPNQANNTPTNSYSQEGYEIENNGAVLAVGGRNADETNVGWADLADVNGRGITMGRWYIGPNYPAELRLHSRGTNAYNAVIELSADQTDPAQQNTATTKIFPGAAQPYYLAWPHYQVDETFWEFHDCNTAGCPAPDIDFAAYQQQLVGRPTIPDWNRSKFYTELYPMIPATTFDTYMNGTCPVGTCPYGGGSIAGWSLTATVPQVMKYWAWRNSGEGNQNELGWENFYKWEQRGGNFAASYLWAKGYYYHFAALALPRADFAGGWRGQCQGALCGNLDLVGSPANPTGHNAGGGKYPDGNDKHVYRDWDNDPEHEHYFEIGDFGILTGDRTILDAANQGWADQHANASINKIVGCGGSGTCLFFARAKGQAISHAARIFTYLQSQAKIQTGNTCLADNTSDPCVDAANARTVGTAVLAQEIAQTGGGIGWGTDWGVGADTVEGQNPLIGWDYQGVSGGADPDSLTTCPVDLGHTCNGYKTGQGFFQDMEIEGCLDAMEAFGSSWVFGDGSSAYAKCFDTAYGLARWWTSEGGWIEHNTIKGGWVGGVTQGHCSVATGTSCTTNGSCAAGQFCVHNCPGACSNALTTKCQQNVDCPTGGTCAGAGTPTIACYPGNPVSGTPSIFRDEFYNSDKPEALNHTIDNSQWMNMAWAILANGSPTVSYPDFQGKQVNVNNAFHEYINYRQTSGAETGSPEENAVVGIFLNPPLTTFSYRGSGSARSPLGHWVTVNLSANGGTAAPSVVCTTPCALTWSNPANVQALRLKTHKSVVGATGGPQQIVDWLLLDNQTDPHNTTWGGCATPITGGGPELDPDIATPAAAAAYPGGHAWYGCWFPGSDPRGNWPWFSSTEVPGITPSISQPFDGTTAPSYDPTMNNAFAIQAFTTSAAVPAASLSASPTAMVSGSTSVLTWSTTDLTSASITASTGPAPGSVCSTALTCAAGGTVPVTPTVTTTYTLSGTGPDGAASQSATVTITGGGVVPTASLVANPNPVPAGQTVTLTWSTTNATSATLNYNGVVTVCSNSGACDAGGSATVTPLATTTYTLIAANGGQTASSSITVTVIPPRTLGHATEVH